MIKNLRKRFIFAAMASTFGVLFVIMSILNIANYARMVSRADDTLSELVDNNGQFDRRDFLKEKVKTNADSQHLISLMARAMISSHRRHHSDKIFLRGR